MFIVRLRKLWFFLSGLAVALSIIALSIWGLNLGIDFTGGSLMEITFTETNQIPDKQEIEQLVGASQVQTSIVVQPVDTDGYIVRMKNLSEEEHVSVLESIKQSYPEVREERFESIGPAIGQELKERALWAILLVLIAIVIYVAWAFRKISYPIASWKYGIIALIALFHDIIITLGIFAILGNVQNIEVGLPFVAALLTILGYSVNDTIVVFDRVRENIHKRGRSAFFPETVGTSISETLVRSLNTSLTTLLVLIAIFIFGGQSIQSFILTLIIGVIAGTYSSLFLASPLLIVLKKWQDKK